MRNKKECIIDELKEIWYILLNAKYSYNYAEYLFFPPTENEKGYMRHYGTEMLFFRKMLWRSSIIELSHLFYEREKRSIGKFLNKVDISGEYRGYISPTKIQELRNELNNFQVTIDKVKEMRDKVFAHADYEYEKSKKFDNLDNDIEKLIHFTEVFISEIFLAFDAGVEHSAKFLKDEFNLLKILADYEDKNYNELIKDFSQPIK